MTRSHETYFDRRDRVRSKTVEGQRWVNHHFSFGPNKQGAWEAVKALTEAGFEYAQSDREGDSDEYWYVITWGWTEPDGETVKPQVEEQMRQIAASCGGEYTGWTLQRTDKDGREPPF